MCGPAASSDPVKVGLSHLWEVKVDHHVHRLRLGKNEEQLKAKSQDTRHYLVTEHVLT